MKKYNKLQQLTNAMCIIFTTVGPFGSSVIADTATTQTDYECAYTDTGVRCENNDFCTGNCIQSTIDIAASVCARSNGATCEAYNNTDGTHPPIPSVHKTGSCRRNSPYVGASRCKCNVPPGQAGTSGTITRCAT